MGVNGSTVKNSFARAFLQVIALLTGLAVAAVWRDHHNRLIDYPDLRSAKAELGLGVNGAQSFLRTSVSLANGALNLGAWFGHQEITVNRDWPTVPSFSWRARVSGDAEIEMGLRDAGGVATWLRVSNRTDHPSAWLTESDRRFTQRTPFSYVLPKGQWVKLRIAAGNGRLTAFADGAELGSFPAPKAPVTVSFRGDSSAGVARIDDIRLRAGEEKYEQSFFGQMPWGLFLVATMGASLLCLLVEALASPQVAAVGAGLGFLVLCALLALYRGELANRYPLAVDLRNAPSRIEERPDALARLRALPENGAPLLLWLGGSQAWGAGARLPEKTVFALLRAKLGGMGLDWVNGAISGAAVVDQAEAFHVARDRRKVAFVVLTVGVNDARNPRFASDLEALVEEVRSTGAKLLLVPEPVESDADGSVTARQREVVAVARRAEIAFAEPQAALSAHVDDGFLWWDFVHLTEAGAQIVADSLEGPLAKALRRR